VPELFLVTWGGEDEYRIVKKGGLDNLNRLFLVFVFYLNFLAHFFANEEGWFNPRAIHGTLPLNHISAVCKNERYTLN